MTAGFSLTATSHFRRLARRLIKRHPEFVDVYKKAVEILREDPLNQTRKFSIKKLHEIRQDEGQFRLRLGRFRLRYDVYEDEVLLRYCGLRREDTYR